MATRKKTNYEKHKEEIMTMVSEGSLCHHCLAREICQQLCKEKSIDPAKQEAPCKEAWITWSNLNE